MRRPIVGRGGDKTDGGAGEDLALIVARPVWGRRGICRGPGLALTSEAKERRQSSRDRSGGHQCPRT